MGFCCGKKKSGPFGAEYVWKSCWQGGGSTPCVALLCEGQPHPPPNPPSPSSAPRRAWLEQRHAPSQTGMPSPVNTAIYFLRHPHPSGPPCPRRGSGTERTTPVSAGCGRTQPPKMDTRRHRRGGLVCSFGVPLPAGPQGGGGGG